MASRITENTIKRMNGEESSQTTSIRRAGRMVKEAQLEPVHKIALLDELIQNGFDNTKKCASGSAKEFILNFRDKSTEELIDEIKKLSRDLSF
jgi:hypothetical protein